VGGTDWTVSPILQFLYGADRPQDILPFATSENVLARRELYRNRYLLALVPVDTARHKEDWWGSAGMAYNRRFWGYRLDTTPQQDAEFIAHMNALPNKALFRSSDNNCADFAAQMVNLYFPGAVLSNKVADFGFMTPKQVARSVAAYGEKHPESHFRVFEVPQVPGSVRRSRPVFGCAEAGLKIKRHVFILSIVQPEALIYLGIVYHHNGRWKIGQNAQLLTPSDLTHPPETALQPTEDIAHP
jgi:hypothetical protein